MKAEKQRLDVLLAQRGLAVSREAAQRLILAGAVRAAGVEKRLTAGLRLDPEIVLTVTASPKYVSRGGLKLEAALDYFGIDPCGMTVLDMGASTGGFTDCVLQRGAAKVIAVDAGRGQLDWRLRADPRVELHEKTNGRTLPAALAADANFAVMDVSFISITLILPRLKEIRPDLPVLSLIKPQFEAGRDGVGPGGIVRDPEVWRAVLEKTGDRGAALGYEVRGPLLSPLAGGDGNREFFYYFVPAARGQAPAPAAIQTALDAAK